jgi:hypothetical protein
MQAATAAATGDDMPEGHHAHHVVKRLCLACIAVLGQVAEFEARKTGAAETTAGADKGKGKAPAGVASGPFCSELQAEVGWGSAPSLYCC